MVRSVVVVCRVFPGDVIVGDSDGVVVIPREIVVEVVDEAREIVAFDEFVQSKLAEGRSLIGLYPATPTSREEYQQLARAARRPAVSPCAT